MPFPSSLLRLLTPVLVLSAAVATSAVPSPEELLRQADAALLEDPSAALSLLEQAAEKLSVDDTLLWRGEERSAEELQIQKEKLSAAHAATADRLSFATYCLDQLTGPDRVTLATELATRHVRDGNLDAALKLAEQEELIGDARIRILLAILDHFHAAGETERVQETTDEMMEIYPRLHPWVQGQVRVDLSDRLVLAERFHDVVAKAHEMGGWEQPFYLSLSEKVFPQWNGTTLLDQALALAQRQESIERAPSFVRLAGAYFRREQTERGKALLRAAEVEAAKASGRDKVMAWGALAKSAADRGQLEEAEAHLAAATQTLLLEMTDWEQSDALIELARSLAGTSAAAIAGPQLEEVSKILSATAAEETMRNKFRVYEFRGVAAATSPAEKFDPQEQKLLFAELVRLDAMPDNTEAE